MQLFSQNNPNWKNTKIGSSNLTVGNYGCTLTSLCTLASYFGETLTPGFVALNKFLFTSDGLIIWTQIDKLFTKVNFFMRCRYFNEKAINLYLENPDTAVLLNVDRGYHWVAALKKTASGYLSSDPWRYPTVKRVYKNNEIVGFSVISKK